LDWRHAILLLLLIPFAVPDAAAWWHPDWGKRMRIEIDVGRTGAPVVTPATYVPMPVRLSSANFRFADARPDGSDLRFVADDDATPLAFHLELFQPNDEVAIAWVLVPSLSSRSRSLWLYFGNAMAVPASDAGATYDRATALVLHYGAHETTPRDHSAYGNHALRVTARLGEPGAIGAAAAFTPGAALVVGESPSTTWAPEHGFTWSSWIRLDAGTSGNVFAQGKIRIAIDGGEVRVRWRRTDGTEALTPPGAAVPAGAWHHVAVVADATRTVVFVDGGVRSELPEGIVDARGEIVLGALPDSPGFSGALDETQMAGVARPPEWIAIAALQLSDSGLVSVVDDAQAAGSAYRAVIVVLLRAVSVDGWVIIGLIVALGLMAGATVVSKNAAFARGRAADRAFLTRFRGSPTLVLPADGATDTSMDGSLLYPAYLAGMKALQSLQRGRGRHDGPRTLRQHELQLLRSAVDQALVSSANELNRGMVRLTMAISGAPFLGLLGTVVGIMITFGTIAMVGDVNVATIAPGVAAALTTTVTGLVVAIPVMFAYNHLTTRIREATVSLELYGSELLARLAADYESAP